MSNVVYLPRSTLVGVRQGFARALASDGDQAESGPADDVSLSMFLPANILLGLGALATDIAFRYLGGGVGYIQERKPFLFVVPKR